MELANQVFFIVFALIALALLLSAIPQFQVERSDLPSFYWPLGVGFYAVCCLSFGVALWVDKFLLTVANTTLIISALSLSLLYRSWNGEPFNKLQTLFLFSIPMIVAILYEPLRTAPNTFYQRVALITSVQEAFLAWQVWELTKYYKKDKSTIIRWLILVTLVTFLGNVFRTYRILTGDGPTNIFLYVEDGWALGLRWIVYASNIMAFVALGVFYLQKKIVKENKIANALEKAKEENEKITELLKEKERLIYGLSKANKSAAAGALSASIAHELNQPLGASLLNIQFLKMVHESGRLTPELLEQLINQLEKDAKRSGDIIRSLQSVFAKSSDDFEEFSVEEVIESALAIYKLDLMDRGITFEKSLNIPIKIYGHKGQFLQVLLNLINNSIQALLRIDTENKTLGINASLQGNFGVVEVFDNGPGVSKEHQAHLFNLLTSDKEKGMGLGLWLCSQIMENFHGKISYEDAPGGGAKFILSLPITPPSGLDCLRA